MVYWTVKPTIDDCVIFCLFIHRIMHDVTCAILNDDDGSSICTLMAFCLFIYIDVKVCLVTVANSFQFFVVDEVNQLRRSDRWT